MKTLFFAYCALVIVMSFIAFAFYKRDKSLAQKGAYRMPERTLLLLAACFGGIGAFAGMRLFRHKTKHLRFQIIVPICMAIQLALLVILAYYAFYK